ncbi:MAG: radical SAM protein [Thermodesulfobacteriota bacterium]
MVQSIPNANFSSLAGKSVHDINDSKYKEYRRQWMENPAKFILSDFPIHLDMEITNRCNLRCTFCDKLPLLSKNQLGDMDFELCRKIIDEGAENGLCGLKLSYRGEPLLHPQVDQIVAYGKRKGILDIYFNTNGMLLSKNMSLKLISAGLDRISISIEGIDPVTFERERKGASFQRIISNISTLLELREQAGSGRPRIRIQTVRLPGLDLEEYSEFWRSHGDEVAVVDFKDVKNRNTDLVDETWACPQLWQRMTIERDGTILACNNDDFRNLSPGNARELSVYESWHSPVVQRARELHKEGKSHLVRACIGCPWRTTQIEKLRSSPVKNSQLC